MYATLSGNLELVQWVLDRGHDSFGGISCSYDKRTVLHIAAEFGYEDVGWIAAVKYGW
jgi:hypothetical protein